MEKRSDLVDYSYLIILDIRNFDQKTRILTRRIRVINIYDQVIGREYTYLGIYIRKRRAIKDINWDKIIIKRIIFINDFNVYNLKWNSTCENLIRMKPLEALLTKFNLIVINEKDILIRRLSEKISIIDLTIIAPSIKDIIIQYILERSYSSISDYEFIIISQPDLIEESAIFNNGRVIGQDI